jgi:hypothetical protein
MVDKKMKTTDLDNILIHIGYGKTGTTWLQENLFNFDNPTFTNLSTKDKRQSTIASNFLIDKNNYPLTSFDDNTEQIQSAFDEIIDLHKNRKTNYWVISQERLVGTATHGGYDSRKNAILLKNHFPKAKILIVIREQKNIIQSHYFQYLNGGGTNKVVKYLKPKNRDFKPDFTPEHFKFSFLIKEYYALFGKENVHVLPYELFLKEPEKFIKSIGKFCTIEIDCSTLNFKSKVNVKSNNFILYYLRQLNTYTRCSGTNNYKLFESPQFQALLAKGFRFLNHFIPKFLNRITIKKVKTEVEDFIGDYYEEDNKLLETLIDCDLKQYRYY